MTQSHKKPAASPKTGYINVRVTPALKRQAEKILSTLGVSTSEAVTMFLRQVVLNKGIPFPVRGPNAETIAAIRDVKEHPDRVTRYDGAADLMHDLWVEDAAS